MDEVAERGTARADALEYVGTVRQHDHVAGARPELLHARTIRVKVDAVASAAEIVGAPVEEHRGAAIVQRLAVRRE